MQPLVQRVKSYIKDTNHFLNKIKKIGKLPEGAILCTMDVVGLYPNIPHGEGLASLYKFLETRENKQISSDTLAELAEIVLKIIYLNFQKYINYINFQKLSDKNVEPLLEPSSRLLMLFFVWLISRKNCWKFLKENQSFF